ncbi:putative amidoligase enzyme [Caudoviricetes sp.]|nr:putative amidoligase enzyme [Caudoviricetes sp.]
MKVSELVNNTIPHREYCIYSNKIMSSNSLIGVEIELEQVEYYQNDISYPYIFEYWKTAEDGSLRLGTEFILKRPLCSLDLIKSLDVFKSFIKMYKKGNSFARVTDRCSVHIHYDVRNKEFNDIVNVILVYILLEKVIFKFVDPLRFKNNYCRPLCESTFINIASELVNSDSLRTLLRIVNINCDKYSAMNLLPISTMGSIEFRHHHGTKDINDIIKWICVVMEVMEAPDINYLLSLSNIDIFEKVFKVSKNQTLISDYVLDNLLNKGRNDVNFIMSRDSLLKDSLSLSSKIKSNINLLEEWKLNNQEGIA